jgi:hypothetical protein
MDKVPVGLGGLVWTCRLGLGDNRPAEFMPIYTGLKIYIYPTIKGAA